ncbi:hypothetical protein prwr041_16370 [Prevotella herbatica]|uniref:Uncharacterized protein n=1 Tax=Prevotella herbatica TaxID=2801997 RepID=A0ABN6ELA2_9BACT|nr:hypothetical protein [Prevotella herbatica]BCS85744.1 hypothetical protein prwr041_16370 [Prevotella herbatica]
MCNFKYKNPLDVISPKEFVENVELLFDGGPFSYSIVKLIYDDSPVIGLRWNVSDHEQMDDEKINGSKECVGIPQSHGVPIWFIIPKSFYRYLRLIIEDEMKSNDIHTGLSIQQISEKIDNMEIV